jgi:hypothetical protein
MNTPRLFISDNYFSYGTYKFQVYCIKHKAHLFLPSHVTHTLQPLDVGAFGLLDRRCLNATNDWTAHQPLHAKINNGAFILLCEEPMYSGVRPHNVNHILEKDGIHPWRPNIVLEDTNVKIFPP